MAGRLVSGGPASPGGCEAMAEITRKHQGELVAGVFQLLTQRVDGLPAKEVLARLRALLLYQPTD